MLSGLWCLGAVGFLALWRSRGETGRAPGAARVGGTDMPIRPDPSPGHAAEPVLEGVSGGIGGASGRRGGTVGIVG
ncbi:hypothetical protein FRAAL6888 [Frankia alni ACN14a]|uniref:Uncharacterized protein n=1 Tax=Frankia alni (strain DSM 45986 / CECT 9034 / ACN14a) TaxID=326424 RepID=Q0RAK2_FRAAA|nr:hypothetical protein FRAAL6888 [Frankia alni ACN14a]